MSYQCPLCLRPLVAHARQWSCGQHVFDRAKEGYVNLLPVQFKRSKMPGDSADMMRARRLFLEAGHYAPLRENILHCLASVLSSQPSAAVLDIGCGEGYYTGALAQHLRTTHAVQVYGLDISKAAIQRAAKRYDAVAFCVASSLRLPFEDAALDAIVKIYAPCNDEELRRVVKLGGWVLTVSPGPRHLYQLKAEVYADVMLHPIKPETLAGFVLKEEHTLAYDMTLNGEQAAALLQMTPFAWRATADVGQRLQDMQTFSCETDFIIRLHQRTAE